MKNSKPHFYQHTFQYTILTSFNNISINESMMASENQVKNEMKF